MKFISTKEKSVLGRVKSDLETEKLRSFSNKSSINESLANEFVPKEPTESELIFSLLYSTSFTFQTEGGFDWDVLNQISSLLKSDVSEIPRSRLDCQALVHTEHQRLYRRALKSLNWKGARYQIQYRLRTGDSQWIWVEETAERTNAEGDPLKIKGVIRDITDEKARSDRTTWLDRHDDMTGLMNQKAFIEQGETLCGLANRMKAEGAIFRLRLRNLDDIIKIYGVETGNCLCRGIADRLRQIIGPPDCLAKDETTDFLLAVLGIEGPDSNPEVLAKRLQIALCKTPYKSPFGPLKAEISVGYTTLPQTGVSVATLLRKTDRALEVRPSDTVSEYLVSMGLAEQQNHDRDISKDDIIAALNENRISLAFQPIVKAVSGDLHHYECLLRLREESGELVSAGRLIMAAEDLGLVHHLDQRALEIASLKLQEQPDLRVALNVSAATIQTLETAQSYLNALTALGERAKRITIEMTETAALDSPDLATHFSTEVRALGCEFSIDDFGSGHTTFRNLMAIEAESIKLDGSLIKGIAASSQKQIFVRMMVDLANTFAVKIVAEMVEDKADAVALKRLGVDYLQGYLYGIPSAVPSYRNPSI